MTTIKRLTLSLVLMLAATAASAQQPSGNGNILRLSLKEAQDYAVAHNYALQNAALDVKKAEATRWQTLSTMLPQVKAGFDYQNMCGYEMNIGGRNSMSSMLPDSITIGGTTLPISFPSSGSSSGTTTGGIPMNPSGTFSITASIALTGAQILGDVVISMEKAVEQAERYGHSLQREVGYLTAHSVLHLLGYDHINNMERVRMREKEEKVMSQLGLPASTSYVREV